MKKRDDFKRIATKRTNDVLEKLRILGNCSNKSNYEYNEEDIKIIFTEIEKKTKQVRAQFSFQKDNKFKL
jgi:hypothetical protein